jgi:hypothetical protein
MDFIPQAIFGGLRSRLIGYVQISPEDQNTDPQLDKPCAVAAKESCRDML